MRNLLIALVLLLTGGLFYSALWYKSEIIEDDITARVTDALDQTGTHNVDIDVDGRHVSLSGVVYDADTETRYLDTADQTFGALGPIDGLTYRADTGFVSATKTAEGVTLRGTVPTEDARADLVAQAASVTDGAVDDQLNIAGPTAAWQDEATFGVTQLAGLTTGTLTATAGSFMLSGTADGDLADVNAALADRPDWSTNITSAGEIDALRAELNSTQTTLSSAQAAQASAQAIILERDATIEELESHAETLASNAQAQIGTLNATVVEKDAVIAGLQGQVTDLEANLEARRSSLGNADAVVSDLEAQLGAANEQIAGRDTTIGALQGSFAAITEEAAAKDQTIADLTGQVGERDVTIAGLREQLDNTTTSTANVTSTLSEESAAKDATIAALTGTVASLEANQAALGNAVDGLIADVAERDATIATLQQNGEQANADLARLNAELEDRDATIALAATQVGTLTSNVEAASGEVAALNGVIAERDATIASLQNSTSAAPLAQQCADQAASVMEGSRINFATATADIAADSVPLLERVTGIALACVGEGTTVEIGGHTDAQGTDANNQALSEARAQAVVAFMTERGVPATGLRAVGFGESQPIADNATPEGRAENRRISFDWAAR